jgi:hypothetical protein
MEIFQEESGWDSATNNESNGLFNLLNDGEYCLKFFCCLGHAKEFTQVHSPAQHFVAS